jgi:hypothetical protein
MGRWVLCTPRVKSASSSRVSWSGFVAGLEREDMSIKSRDHICDGRQSILENAFQKGKAWPAFPMALIRFSFRLSPDFPTRQCLRLLRLLRRPRSGCPPSLARKRKGKSSSTSTPMRNRHPPIPPDCTLAAQEAPANPEAPFLHPNVHLKPDSLPPALHRTPPLQRSLMPNRNQKPPQAPEPKNLPLWRTGNHSTFFPE